MFDLVKHAVLLVTLGLFTIWLLYIIMSGCFATLSGSWTIGCMVAGCILFTTTIIFGAASHSFTQPLVLDQIIAPFYQLSQALDYHP